MDIFLARQPIFDKSNNIYGYEILFRDDEFSNEYMNEDGDHATLSVIRNSFNIGVENIVGNKKAFINFTENILRSKLSSIIPSENIIIEILENVRPKDEIINICRDLKRKGFIIALDDFVFNESYVKLIEIVDIIKIDFNITKGNERREIIETIKRIASKCNNKIKFLAEKVETIEEFNEALALGYSYFQGYYFSKPKLIKGKKIPENKYIYLNLLNELGNREFSIDNIESLIKKDVALCYELFKMINSPMFYFENEIRTIRHAIALIGEINIKKWLYFVCMKPISKDKPDFIMIESLLRAKFAEILVKKAKLNKYSFNAYLTGILSLVHVMLEKPLEEILENISVPSEVKNALTGKKINIYSELLEIIVSYENGEWDKCMLILSYFNLDRGELINSYVEAISWVNLNI
ncbi:MAG: EAL domain-containing protein [Clostridium sp.]|uniref:EAL and HDOD domain-containing protein n=1 Tax=Clostridium sp. TaxID=1506 RepID=UPI0039EC3414